MKKIVASIIIVPLDTSQSISIRVSRISSILVYVSTANSELFSKSSRENLIVQRIIFTSSIIDKDINGCGRGINVAVVDSVTRSILSVSNYDTYTKDSSALETLLLTIRKGDIVILLTFDEPSSKLSQVTRLLLHELGSGMAQNLQHRASWYLVTQKGIKGKTHHLE